MNKADAAKLRVDYVAIHFYRCGFTAQQLYDWLYDIHVQTGRPIWITEFNNGANWTSCTDPTYEQNATRISEFIDMMDKLFRGETTTATLLRYFAFATPRFIYFVVPMSVLVSALVTVGVMTKNSELLVLRACGISLYRAMAPLVVFALLASVSLFVLQDRVLASTNREADRLEAQIRGWSEQSTALTQHWRLGTDGQIYLFDTFEPKPARFARFTGLPLNFRLNDSGSSASSSARTGRPRPAPASRSGSP